MAIPPLTPDDPVLKLAKFEETKVLDRVFELILRMLATMQNTATAQAERLTFLTKWQKGYTDVMNQVKVLTSTDTSLSASLKGMSDSERGNINQTTTQQTEVLRNRRSIISDDSKALQSNVNQTNDAVNQQSTLGTSILQQLATILSSIYR